MSNICGNYLEISGSDNQLEALYKSLKAQEPALLETVPNFEINVKSDYCIYDEDSCTRDEDGDICLSFGSRNSPPLEEITSLSSEYPDLEFKLNYEEGGCCLFGEAFIQDGSCNENELEEREYCEKYNANYQEELEALNNCSYEEFLEKYTHDNFFDEHPYAFIDRNIVDRIKQKDLPKFISREWMDNDAHEEYKRRLAGGSTVEPETEE